MAKIHLLDHNTIDKIAAGEVVEKPASVVKELIENAIDAGADALTVEIKNGGIDYIRITDNGQGIDREDVQNAFLRHATSKLTKAEDLQTVMTLGFRGEALSSICAVAKVEMITKTKSSLLGTRYVIEGAKEVEFSEVGAPDGTTIIVRNLFYNVPARRKFLNSPITEGGYIADLVEHIALSRPSVSFKFVNAGSVKFHTSGNGDLKEIIYRIYGKDTASGVVPLSYKNSFLHLYGYIGKPVLNRGSRGFENYFLNGRYIKSKVISGAIEEGYKEFLMQHKFPFTVLHIDTEPDRVDVNVHPAKMEVRITNEKEIYELIRDVVYETLKQSELIPEIALGEEKEEKITYTDPIPEPFESKRIENMRVCEEKAKYSKNSEKYGSLQEKLQKWEESHILGEDIERLLQKNETKPSGNVIKAKDHIFVEKPVQMDFFEEKLLSKEAKEEYDILGQIFDTYWLVAFKDKLYIIDQHAAHEKVKYEEFMKKYYEKEIISQSLNPPLVISLSAKEEAVLKSHWDVFASLGFLLEEFGGNEYAVRGVPVDLYGHDEQSLFLSILDELCEDGNKGNLTIEQKIASMSCKAAVKGNNRLSKAEMEALLDKLLELENPYNCPHGRPTIISMSKYEIEKKFKRIV